MEKKDYLCTTVHSSPLYPSAKLTPVFLPTVHHCTPLQSSSLYPSPKLTATQNSKLTSVPLSKAHLCTMHAVHPCTLPTVYSCTPAHSSPLYPAAVHPSTPVHSSTLYDAHSSPSTLPAVHLCTLFTLYPACSSPLYPSCSPPLNPSINREEEFPFMLK